MDSLDERGTLMIDPIRYRTADEVPAKPWLIQGTVFSTMVEAKMAALKLFASLLNDGVTVKQIGNGYTCFYWRKK